MGFQNEGRNRRNFGGQDNNHRGGQGYSYQNYQQEEQYDEYMGQQEFQGGQDYEGNAGQYEQPIGGNRENRYFDSKVQQRPNMNQGQGGYSGIQGQKSKNYGMQSPDYFEEEGNAGQGQNMRNMQGSYRGAGYEGGQVGRNQMGGHQMHHERGHYGDNTGNHNSASAYQTGGVGYSNYKSGGQGATNNSQTAMKQQPHGTQCLNISQDRKA